MAFAERSVPRTRQFYENGHVPDQVVPSIARYTSWNTTG
jgi:hypothetical protein